MKYLFLLCVLLLVSDSRAADSLYSRAFGDAKDPAVIFLHGGPGYNAASFEVTSAQRLADSGFFVIVFDQRGCGRSAKVKGTYTLDEVLGDVLSIYDRYGIKKASLLGHSWGGTLAMMFAEVYPERVKKLVLTDAPLSYPRAYRTILARCTDHYAIHDTAKLTLMRAIATMDTTSMMYASSLFMHAGACGLYSGKNISEEAKLNKPRIKQDTLSRLMNDMKQAPVMGLSKSIKYNMIDHSSLLPKLTKKLAISAIYGDEDGLFDTSHLDAITSIVGKKHFMLVAGAGHSVFLDQPTQFFTALVKILNAR
jgi:proline iminopeptidase